MNVLKLEDFFEVPDPSLVGSIAQAEPQSADLEAARLEGYETGYQAGWDDALKSNELEHAHIEAEFARNLEELSFTFFEARRHVCLSLKPLVAALVEKVAPAVLRTHFQSLVEETLLPLVEAQSVATIELICASEDEPLLEKFLSQQDRLPVVLRPEASFHQGQVRFSIGHETHDIDASALTDEFLRASQDFFDTLVEDKAYG